MICVRALCDDLFYLDECNKYKNLQSVNRFNLKGGVIDNEINLIFLKLMGIFYFIFLFLFFFERDLMYLEKITLQHI
jgi:hypothetical protein